MIPVGYFYVVLSVFAGTAKGVVTKKLSGSVQSSADNFFINGFRMFFCTLIGLVVVLCTQGPSALAVDGAALAISFLSAVSFSFFVYAWIQCVQTGAVVMVDVFLTAGVAIPVIGGCLLWGGNVSVRQWIGMGILVVGVLILCSYNNSIKQRMSKRLVFWLLVCGAANGVASLSQKMFHTFCPLQDTSVFNFYTYFFSMLLFGGALLRKKTNLLSHMRDRRLMLQIGSVSVFLYLNLMFKMLAGLTLTAVQLYPFSQGLGIVNSSVSAMIFFRERITVRCVIGILVSICALLLINL